MNTFSKSIASCLIISCTFTQQAHADWFSKGLEFLKGDSDDSSSTISSISESLLSDDTIVDAFKQALEIGSEKVSSQLGAADGFNADELIHIPLPENLQKASSALEKIGMSSFTDDLELKLNRAAEAAAPQAKEVFISAIQSMNFEDVQAIYKGPSDSATQFFKANMTEELTAKMTPIINQSLSEVGAISAYDSFISQYDSIPFMPDLKDNLNTYVLEKGLDGIFHYLAEEEAAIRENPLERTTELLQQVFGGN